MTNKIGYLVLLSHCQYGFFVHCFSISPGDSETSGSVSPDRFCRRPWFSILHCDGRANSSSRQNIL